MKIIGLFDSNGDNLSEFDASNSIVAWSLMSATFLDNVVLEIRLVSRPNFINYAVDES